MINSFNIGPIVISFYAIMILLGATLSYLFIRREWLFKQYDITCLNDFFFNVLIVGILGARLWYVIFTFENYITNPLEIFAIWQGGLAIHGGLFAGVTYGYYYFSKRGYNFLDVADTILPYVLIAQAIGRWGNFFNQEAYGGKVSYTFLESLHIPEFIINGMFINNSFHHPTFLYESILNIIALIIIRIIIHKVPLKIGQAALLYPLFYGIVRFFVESLRTDSLMVFGLRTAQVTSIIMVIGAIIGIIILNKVKDRNTFQERLKTNGK